MWQYLKGVVCQLLVLPQHEALQGGDGDDVDAAYDDVQAARAPLPLQLDRHL